MRGVRGAGLRLPLGRRALAGHAADAHPSGAPVQVFLETRAHVDLDGLDDELAGELGRMMVRLDRAIQAVGGIGRVHVNRWGDAGSHFHLWCYGRPLGDQQMLGFCAPLWAMTLPPTPAEEWDRNLASSWPSSRRTAARRCAEP